MLRLLHLADLHLGWRPRYLDDDLARERQQQRDNLLDRAVDFALEQRLDAVVIAGDLFETYDPPEGLVHRVMASLQRLEDAGIFLLTTPGNHDEITYVNSVYRKHKANWPGVLVTNPDPELVHSGRVGGRDVNFYSLAYTGGITPAGQPLTNLPHKGGEGLHIAVFHGTLGMAQERSLPLDRAALGAVGYDYVALGHIHKPRQERLGASPVVYPGCIEGKGFDDPGTPNWTVVNFGETGVRIETPPVEVQTIRVETIDLTLLTSPEELEERIVALGDVKAQVRILLTGTVQFEIAAEDLVGRHAHRFWHLEVRDRSDSLDPELIERWGAQKTVRGAFIRQMGERLQAAETEEERLLAQRALLYGLNALRLSA